MKMGIAKGNLTTATTQSISYDSALGDAEAFILFVSSHTNTGTVTDGSGFLIWMSDGTNEHSAYSWIAATAINNAHDRGRNSKGYFAEDGTVRLDGTSSIDTAADEIDLVFTSGTAPTSTFEYCLVTFHGTDVNALCVSHDGTDQTESIGFDWDFLVSTGASTTSTTSTNGAINWGVCDKSGNQGVARYGAGDGTGIHFSIFRNDAINTNIFNTSQFEVLDVDTITTNGFNLDCSVASNNDEPGVYLCIGCDNSVEVVTNQTLTASTGDENVTVSHATEYALFGGVVGTTTVNSIEYTLSGGESSFFVGACDLSAGADTSGDYFAYGWGGSGSNVEAELTHSGCIVGTTGTGGSAVLADISSVGSPSPTVVGKATAGTTTRMWFLNIGEEPAGGAKALAGISTGVARTNGALVPVRSLDGDSRGVARTNGALNREAPLAGVVQAVARVNGAVNRETFLAGVVNGVARVSGDELLGSGALAGTTRGEARTVAALIRETFLAGETRGVARTNGDLIAERFLSGTTRGEARTGGELTTGKLLSGTTRGEATVNGALDRTAPLAGTSRGEARTIGNFIRSLFLSGSSRGVARTVGAVTVISPEDTDRTEDSYEVRSVLQGPQSKGMQNAPRGLQFFESWVFQGTEGNNTVIRLCVLPPYAQVVSLIVAHDNVGTYTIDVGDADDPDGYLDGVSVSAAGAKVAQTFIRARATRSIIQVKLIGSGVVNPGSTLRIQGFAMLPNYKLISSEEWT